MLVIIILVKEINMVELNYLKILMIKVIIVFQNMTINIILIILILERNTLDCRLLNI
jgi:hypothetical protein